MRRDVQMGSCGDTAAETATRSISAASSQPCDTKPAATLSWRERWAHCFEQSRQLEDENATLRSTIAFQERTIAELKEDLAGMAPVVNRRSVKLLRRLDFVLRPFVWRKSPAKQPCPGRSGRPSQGWRTLADIARATIQRFRARRQPPSLLISMVVPAERAADGPDASLPTGLHATARRFTARCNASAETRSYEYANSLATIGTTDEVLRTPMTFGGKQATAEEQAIQLVVLSPVPRSGSTLLQRICNARKGTLVWGEHNAVLSHFTRMLKNAQRFDAVGKQQREDFFASGEDPNLWIANLCPDPEHFERTVVASARILLNRLYDQYRESHNLIGFKEVRYGLAEAELLRKCYPTAKMLLLVRHPCNTWNSTPREWYPRLDEWIALWNRNAQAFQFLDASDENCHLIRYEDLVKREPATLKTISDTARLTNEQILDVLACKLGSRHQGLSEEERRTINEQCQEVMAMLGYQ
jgi:hypothetical protein